MQKMPVSKYLCRRCMGIDHRGLSGIEKMTMSVNTLMLEMAVP